MENLNPNDLTAINAAKAVANSLNVVCKCGSKVFIPAVVLKKVSALVSPSGKEELVDIPVYVCAKCGEVPEEFKSKPNYAKIFGENINNQNLVK